MKDAPVGPFSGVKVVDFTHVLAGPACTYQLALLGADVIKVEKPGNGDTLRTRAGSAPDLNARGLGTNFLAQNANKRSIALDLTTAGGAAAFLKLADRADVLVENHRTEFMTGLGLSAETLCARNERLIYCRLTGYGATGPRGNDTAYDVNIQAASGLMSMTGTPATGPLRCGPPILDYATGMTAAFAIAAALCQRGETGRGQILDVSMLDVAMTLMSANITDMLATGVVPMLRGNQADSGLPTAGSFPTADGLLSLGINSEDQFGRFAFAVGKGEWFDDPRLADSQARAQDPAYVRDTIIEVLAERSAADWEDILRAEGVPCARVNTLPEAIKHPQARHRRLFQELPDVYRDGQTVAAAQSPFRMSAAPDSGRIVSAPPALGADTRAILMDLGLGPDEIESLIESGAAAADDGN